MNECETKKQHFSHNPLMSTSFDGHANAMAKLTQVKSEANLTEKCDFSLVSAWKLQWLWEKSNGLK